MNSQAFACCCLAFVVTSCATEKYFSNSVEGTYKMFPAKPGLYFAGETIKLENGLFTYVHFTDALGDPASNYPKDGEYSIEGCLLTLRFKDIKAAHYILTPYRGSYLMWAPIQYEEYLRTHKIPDGVLFKQKPLSSPPFFDSDAHLTKAERRRL